MHVDPSSSSFRDVTRRIRGDSSEVDHQAIEHVLQVLDAGLRDVHVDLGGAQGLVTEHGLDGAQGDAGLEQVRRVAVSLMPSSA